MSPARIFYSYAHEDKDCRDELSSYLGALVLNNKIEEWYDRHITPGVDYNIEINARIENSDIIIFLISKDFLKSKYCFGIETDKAFILQKQGKAKIVPVLLSPCLLEESRFTQLQVIPRDAVPISISPSRENAFNEVAREISNIVNDHLKNTKLPEIGIKNEYEYPSSLSIIKQQVTSFANLYERTRQLMKPSHDRTIKMQAIFDKMKSIAHVCYPFLEEFSKSPLPGERLAAISILQTFAIDDYFTFLAKTIGSEKPFVGYQAVLAISFAINSVTPKSYDALANTIAMAKQKLVNAEVGFDTDRFIELTRAENELNNNIKDSG
ncbi:MAG: toll/interleukin-1 receptor domain-containing protein [Ferruginibacter sp.]